MLLTFQRRMFQNDAFVQLLVGTGYISFDEFCDIVKKKIEDDDYERELKEMFRALDTEKRGEVNTKELR